MRSAEHAKLVAPERQHVLRCKRSKEQQNKEKELGA